MYTVGQIIIDVDSEIKDAFYEMAVKRGISISDFILGIILDGARLERRRRMSA